MKTLKGTCIHCGHTQTETTKHNNVSCSTGYCDKCGKVGMNMYPEMKNKDWETIEKIIDGVFLHGRETPTLSYELPKGQFTVQKAVELIEKQIKQAKIEAVGEFYDRVHTYLDLNTDYDEVDDVFKIYEQYIKNLEDKDSEVLTKPFYIFKLTVDDKYIDGAISDYVPFEEAIRMLRGGYRGCEIIYLIKNDN